MSNIDDGIVLSVRGGVVEVAFTSHLPPIYSLLHAGKNDEIILEVHSQPDEASVRAIALTATGGLARGMKVKDTGTTLKAPVGKEILSRMFNVFGDTIDRRQALTKMEQRSVHQEPLPLARRTTQSEIFETGIKVIDILTPLERGGKAGMFGGEEANRLEGGGGNDIIWGEGGDDILIGGAGNDELNGGLGNNILDGGSGYEIITYRAGTEQCCGK